MLWPDWTKDAVLLLLGGAGTAFWFYWRRKAEQTPIFENIQKAEKLLSLRQELDTTNYTVNDLKNLEDALMGRAQVAKELSVSYEDEARQVRSIDSGAMTQSEMNVAAGQAHLKAESRLNAVVEQMKSFYSPAEREKLDETNAAWREYQMKNASFFASRFEGGSMQPLILSSTLEAGAVTRIVELEAELNFLRSTQSPCSGSD